MSGDQDSLFEQKGSFVKLDSESIPYNKSVLKSAVQKCVRRGMADQAVRLAKAGIQKDITDFARRLLIIVPEDAVIHPLYPELAEITKKVSTKKGIEQVTKEDLNIMLKIVYDIAKTEWRDFDHGNPDERYGEFALNEMNDEQIKMVEALDYRSKIGGMKWDIIFLKKYVAVWTYRFQNGFSLERINDFFGFEYQPDWDSTPDMTAEDIPLVAIDIHCFPPIKRLLLKKTQVRNHLLNYMRPIHKYFNASSEDTLIHDIMWHSYISENYKKVFWMNPPQEANRMEIELGASVEEQKMIKSFRDVAMPEIENIARWFIRKQLEK